MSRVFWSVEVDDKHLQGFIVTERFGEMPSVEALTVEIYFDGDWRKVAFIDEKYRATLMQTFLNSYLECRSDTANDHYESWREYK